MRSISSNVMITENDIATLLDRRIKRYEEMKVIEAINGNPQPQIDHTIERPQIERHVTTNDKRFRRLKFAGGAATSGPSR